MLLLSLLFTACLNTFTIGKESNFVNYPCELKVVLSPAKPKLNGPLTVTQTGLKRIGLVRGSLV